MVAIPPCPVIPGPPPPLRIRIPGGITIEGLPPMEGQIITPLGAVTALLNQLGPAMAGLQPIFLVMDAIKKTVEVIKAVPTFPTDPVDFFEKLNDVVTAISALTQFEPSLSLPLLISDMMNAMVTILTALRDLVTQLQALASQAEAVIAQALASGDAALEAAGECMQQQADAYGEHVTASLGPLEQLLDMVKLLAGLMPNAPEIPSIGDATGLDLDGLADFLDDLIAVFSAIEIPGAG